MRTTTILLLILIATSANAQADSASIEIGHKYTMYSEAIGGERTFYVNLPDSYDDQTYAPQDYPVLFVLDGDPYFETVSGIVHFMSSAAVYTFQMPEVIIVGIPHSNRTADLTPTNDATLVDGNDNAQVAAISGGGAKLLRFLHDELTPHIDTTYRTMDYRVIIGHSLGGLLALYDLASATSTFGGYIALDPSLWWDDDVTITMTQDMMKRGWDKRASVFLAQAHSQDIGGTDVSRHVAAIKAFAALFDPPLSTVRFAYRYYDGEAHDTVPLPGFYDGLSFIFEGYRPNFDAFLADPDVIALQYAAVSKRLGVTMLPPEAMVDMMGGWELQLGKSDDAVTCFALNTDNYPQSSHAYDQLAAAYLQRGDRQLAIDNWRTALELDPDNTNARDRLSNLMK